MIVGRFEGGGSNYAAKKAWCLDSQKQPRESYFFPQENFDTTLSTCTSRGRSVGRFTMTFKTRSKNSTLSAFSIGIATVLGYKDS